MAQKFHRNLFLNVNRYQQKIITPVLMACAFTCLLMIICFVFLIARMTNASHIGPFRMTVVQFYMPWIIMLASYIMIYIVYYVYKISNQLLGPFERIIRELDETIEGKRKTPLGARQGDEMFEQLLKRINTLIERLK